MKFRDDRRFLLTRRLVSVVLLRHFGLAESAGRVSRHVAQRQDVLVVAQLRVEMDENTSPKDLYRPVSSPVPQHFQVGIAEYVQTLPSKTRVNFIVKTLYKKLLFIYNIISSSWAMEDEGWSLE